MKRVAAVGLGLALACTPVAPDREPDAGAADGGLGDAGACAVECHESATCAGARCVPPRVTELAAGDRATCALVDRDEVWCWGRNEGGGLGQGDLEPRDGAVRVRDLPTPILALEGGYGGACVIAGAERELVCWGDNRGGRFADAGDSLAPQPITAAAVEAVAIGESHLCAIVDGGATVSCRGTNQVGQLGRPAESGVLGWGPVLGLPAEVTSIAATWITSAATCVIAGADREVWCWGANDDLLLGLDDGTPSASSPQRISGAAGCSDLSMGNRTACAVCASAVVCWGTESDGQLGGGGDSAVAALVPFVSDPPTMPSSLAVGSWATLLVDRADGSVWGWGESDLGVLGVAAGMIVEPARLHPFDRALQVVGSASHTCVLLDVAGERRVRCAGSNESGQLGSESAGRLTSFTDVTVFSAP